MTGLGLGALAGLGVLAGVIPVVGPAIAAGTLGVVLSNAAAGAGIAGLVGALVGAGIPEHEAEYYHGELESGRTIVTVTAEGRADEAADHHAAARGLRHEQPGHGRRHPPKAANPLAATSSAGSSAHATKGHAERHHRGEGGAAPRRETRPIETGAVTVRKEVHTETRTIDVPVKREEVVIERTAVHGRAAAGGVPAGDIREGEVIRIPVSEEQVHVTKEAVVTEEVKVGKRVVEDTQRVSGQVRKEEVKIDQAGDVDVKTHGTGHHPA